MSVKICLDLIYFFVILLQASDADNIDKLTQCIRQALPFFSVSPYKHKFKFVISTKFINEFTGIQKENILIVLAPDLYDLKGH